MGRGKKERRGRGGGGWKGEGKKTADHTPLAAFLCTAVTNNVLMFSRCSEDRPLVRREYQGSPLADNTE